MAACVPDYVAITLLAAIAVAAGGLFALHVWAYVLHWRRHRHRRRDAGTR